MYVNSRQKNALYCIFGIKCFVEQLLEEPTLPNQKEVKRNLKALANQAQKVIDVAMRDLDDDARIGLWKFSRDMQLACISKADPRADAEYHLVKHDDLVRVMSSSDECLFCDKKGHEARNCDLRKTALRMQLCPAGKGDCPYKRDF